MTSTDPRAKPRHGGCRGDWGRLVAWYRRAARDLPWRRRSEDPWAVLVSEIMLQQTRVETVLSYYEPFLARFPTAGDLAAAPIEDVLAAWSGLGYYRRARHLHAASIEVVRRHGGTLPSDPAAIRDLPGVGPYTAGAVLSIAFGRAEPVLDGNVVRVLSRYGAVGGDPARAATRARLREAARRALAGRAPGEFNQALMELGATVCLPASPRCAGCPIGRGCAARRAGEIERYPEVAARPVTVEVARVVAAIARRGRFLLVRRRGERRLEGFLEFPGLDLAPGEAGPAALAAHLEARYGLEVAVGGELGAVRHSITHHRITCRVFEARAAGRVRASGDLTWSSPRDLDRAPVPAQTRRILALLCDPPGRG